MRSFAANSNLPAATPYPLTFCLGSASSTGKDRTSFSFPKEKNRDNPTRPADRRRRCRESDLCCPRTDITRKHHTTACAIQPSAPADNIAYLKDQATGTQNYVCLPSGTGVRRTFIAPQATLFFTYKLLNTEKRQQITLPHGKPTGEWTPAANLAEFARRQFGMGESCRILQ